MRSITGVLIVAVLGIANSHAIAAPLYRITDLGALGGSSSQPRAINEAGQVVGEANTDGYNEPPHAFLYDKGLMHDLGTLGGKYSGATGINDLGQVVGGAYTTTGEVRAFLYSGGIMQDLGTLGGDKSDADQINNS